MVFPLSITIVDILFESFKKCKLFLVTFDFVLISYKNGIMLFLPIVKEHGLCFYKGFSALL